MQCAYCKTENDKSVIRYVFCEAELTSPRFQVKPFIAFDGFKKYSELNTYHTYDLLKLLKDVRKERSNAFQLLSMTLKLSNNIELPDNMKMFQKTITSVLQHTCT